MISSVLRTSVLLGGHEHDHSVKMVMFHFSTLTRPRWPEEPSRFPNSGRNFGLFPNSLYYATLDTSNEIHSLHASCTLIEKRLFMVLEYP